MTEEVFIPGVLKYRHQKSLNFLEEVKDYYANNPEMYITFLNVMQELKGAKIDVATCVSKVHKLFGDNKYLLEGFNAFVPAPYQVNADFIEDVAELPSSPTYRQSDISNDTECLDIIPLASSPNDGEEGPKQPSNNSTSQQAAENVHIQSNMIEENNEQEKEHASGTSSQPTVIEKKKAQQRAKRQRSSQDTSFKRKQKPPKVRKMENIFLKNYIEERSTTNNFFMEIKNTVGESLYVKFLDVVNLYTREVLTKHELLSLCKKLFVAAPHLYDQMEDYIEDHPQLP